VTLALETVHLAGGRAEAWLAPERGGLLTRFSLDGEDVLYLDEASLADRTKNVRGGVPILFPIAGKLAPDVLPGATAPLKQHGFARNLAWRVIEAAADRATLGLDASDETRAAFPHDFALRYTYTISEGSLIIDQRFENLGEGPMRIQPGLHPYFRVEDKARARITTDATLAWDNVAGERRPFRADQLDLAAGEVDLHLLDHGSPRTRLSRPGARDIVLEWSADQAVLVLWTLPGRPFVCVEPWSAPANALHTGGGLQVPPGGAHTSVLTIRLA
jgi:galactose mutarotase-like enzyme